MKLIHTRHHRKQFDIFMTTSLLQGAMMTLRGDAASDDQPSNEHRRSEQWLFVISGTGTANIVPRGGRRRSVKLRPGTLLVIERGDLHQIKNAGRHALRTITFYAPPAYKKDGSVRPSAK
jgi:mannose-6-phosphate isomerase-like protein (cupin superfamily)